MSRKDSRRSLPLVLTDAERRALRALRPRPAALAAIARGLIAAALADPAGVAAPEASPRRGQPIRVQLAPPERAALASAAARHGMTEADAALGLLRGRLGAAETSRPECDRDSAKQPRSARG
ncbi:MAG: hypothetical protein ACK4TB_12810 [Gemmobacter sp.]